MKLGKNDKKTRVRKLQCVIFYFYKYIHFERFKNPTSRKLQRYCICRVSITLNYLPFKYCQGKKLLMVPGRDNKGTDG